MSGGTLELTGSLRGVDSVIVGNDGSAAGSSAPGITLGAGQQVQTRQLTLHRVAGLQGSITASGADALVTASQLNFSPGSQLLVRDQAHVSIQEVVMNGGRLLLAAGTLRLADGTVSTEGGAPLDLTNVGRIVGYGSIDRISGGANTRIEAQGGQMRSLGDMSFDGSLDIGGNLFAVLNSNRVRLGRSTTLADGGMLLAANISFGGPVPQPQIVLDLLRTLTSTGAAQVLGAFTNNGLVTAQTGTLTFAGGVDGSGGYQGSIRFLGEFSPGNSPAAVRFGGGDVELAAGSLLTMELTGDLAGVGYDQLLDVDTLILNGGLHLAFGDGYAPQAGQQFQLFDAQQIIGLDPTRITASGLAGMRLDTSALASQGIVSLASPVP